MRPEGSRLALERPAAAVGTGVAPPPSPPPPPPSTQPPPSALSLRPLTLLDWRDATRVYLVLNHVFLLAAVALTLSTLRPSLPLRWLIAGAAGIVAAHAQVNASFAPRPG